ncbi:MAG: hypothetical protein GF353_01025 [Candidatus Lokiarchaeota archaeon]|nr:hypothetical protein [Candidatus Lokiarchaeota archaeon]
MDRVVRLKKGSVNAVEHKGSFTGGSGKDSRFIENFFYLPYPHRAGWVAGVVKSEESGTGHGDDARYVRMFLTYRPGLGK